jgi:cytochrome c oxidase subunit 2
MSDSSRLFPVQASVGAVKTDTLFLGLLAFATVIALIVLALVVGFAVRYRKGSPAPRGPLPRLLDRQVEIGWTAATAFAALFIFWWASSIQLVALNPPKNALEIHVVGKQWMWKTQHPSGAREINALHAPVNTPVKLVMTSQDVIHSFFVPAFRMKQDVVPGRYTETWFNATKLGTYPLYCSEFCGTDHSLMTGEVIVMPASDYARWARAQPNADTLADQGRGIFSALGCSGCHGSTAKVPAPPLAGLYGRSVVLADHRTVRADEQYLRDSILLPNKDVVAGYDPIMPAYQGVAGEDDVIALVAYLKSLSPSSHEEAAR